MSDHLSSEDLDQLVSAASRDGVHAGGRRRQQVRSLDFSRPMKLSPADQARFEAAHASWCREGSVRLSSELRATIELEVISVAQVTWAAAMHDLPGPSVFATVLTAPADTRILIAVEEVLLVRMLERLLGGGHGDPPIGRSLTEIDMAVARRVFGALTETLSAAWKDLLGLGLSLVDVEPQHANVDLVPPSEPTLALTIQARDDAAAATISALVPYSAIASASAKLTGKARNDTEGPGPDTGAPEAMRSAVGGVDVELRAEVASVELPLAVVLALAVGDVVRLGPVGREALLGGASRLHRVRPGRSGARRAVQIIERLDGR